MLQQNSSLEQLPLICNQLNAERGSSRPPAPLSCTRCDAGRPTVSIRDNDLMIMPAHRRNTATVEATRCCRPADLHAANMSRRGECPVGSRIIFNSSSSTAAGDHERGLAVAGPWSPRCYACSFCGREFKSAQALGGHMNIHRRDRARLRITSTPLIPSVLPEHADLSPAPQNTPPSGQSTLYLPFEAACRDNPTLLSSSLNTYPPPTIISAAPALRLLEIRSAADPMAAVPHHDDNSAAPFSPTISDLVSFCIGSTRSSLGTRFSQIQNGFSPNIAPHASSLLLKPMLQDRSFKPAETMNVCGGQAFTKQSRLDCSGAKAAGRYTAPEGIQLSQAKGRNKRPRGVDLDAVKISSEDKPTVQRCDERLATTENSNRPLHTAPAPARSCVRPTHDVQNNIKELNCLDLELRLGRQSSLASADN